MYVCMCVYVYVCVYVYECVCVCVSECTQKFPSFHSLSVSLTSLPYTTLHFISVQVEYARTHASIRGCKYLELMALIVRAKLHAQAGKCNEVLVMLQHTK